MQHQHGVAQHHFAPVKGSGAHDDVAVAAPAAPRLNPQRLTGVHAQSVTKRRCGAKCYKKTAREEDYVHRRSEARAELLDAGCRAVAVQLHDGPARDGEGAQAVEDGLVEANSLGQCVRQRAALCVKNVTRDT